MKCYMCGKIFSEKRTFRTLFKENAKFRCPSCEKKYRVMMIHQVMPKTNGLFHIYSLFKEDEAYELLAFQHEINHWFFKVLKEKKQTDHIIWMDKIDNLLLEYLDEVDGSIYILTTSLSYFS